MIASAYGLQYELPQDSMSRSPIRGGLGSGQQDQTPIDFGQNNLLNESLYVKEGMTDQYYKKVAALKSFANEVSSRYGYDVTRPNYRDKESIKFHKAYLESLADLQRDQNELKRLGQMELMSIQSPDVVMRTDQETGRDFAANIGENATVKRIAETAKQIQSEQEADIFINEIKPMIISQLTEEMNSSRDPRERAELEASIRQIEAIRPDIGISPAQQAQLGLQERGRAEQERHNRAMEGIQRARANREQSGGRMSQAELNGLGRLETMMQMTRDKAVLNAHNLEQVQMASGTFIRKLGDTNSDKWVRLDDQNPEAFMRKLNGLINEDKADTSVGFDVLQRSGIDVNQFGRGLISNMGASRDITQSFIANFDSIASLASDDNNTAKAIISAIESGGQIPDSISNKIGSSLSDKKITNISLDQSGMFGFGSNRINISVPNKKGNGTKSFQLYFSDPEHREMIKEIINFNKDRIPRQIIEQLLPAGASSGTNVAPDDGESLEDII